jgi:hypothetical protein
VTPWSPLFRKLLSRGNLVDTAVGWGIEPTWFAFGYSLHEPKLFALLTGLRFDHILTSPRILR